MSHLEERWNATRAVLRARRDDPPLVRMARDQTTPASFAQEGLWFLDRLCPCDSAYNLAVALRLRGALDVQALERSLADLVQRHEILRTTLEMRDEGLVQRVGPTPEAILRTHEVGADAVSAWSSARASESFDLGRGPLFRADLATIAEYDHCLVLTNHHSILDAWSFEIFMRELCACYEAHQRHQPSPLGPPPLQYGDFAVWQRRRLTGEFRDGLVAYWRDGLPSETPALVLPTDHPRTNRLNRRGASQSKVYDKALAAALTALARRESGTLYMVLLAAFKILLHRHSGDTELIVGSPVAIRNRPELAGMLGMLINTVPLRSRIDDRSTFREILSQVHETVTGALAHQDLPFELLVRELGRNRHASSPLFQVMFAFQNVPRSHWHWPALECEAWDAEPQAAKFDLTLTMQNRDEGLVALLAYDADLFASSTIERMLEHLGHLLDGIATRPDRRVGQTPLLCAAERDRVLAEGQGPSTTWHRSIHRQFEAQAQRSPAATALVTSQGEKIRYDEVNRRANRLARRLGGLGLGSDALVGICLDRSAELIVAELGILKAGAAYVPITDAPPTRLQQILGQVAAVVTENAWQSRLSSLAVPRILVDDEHLADGREDDLETDGWPESLAYVMFTSGTSGEPRGVCIPHRGVMRLVTDTSYARLAPDEVFLQLAPTAFDASTFEIWGALLNGATLVMAPAHPLSVAEIGVLIAHHRVTTLWLTSGLFELVVEAGLEGLGTLRQVLTGGDVMSVRHARRFRERWPDCRLLNCYGPTENTTFTSTYQVEKVEAERSIPIGRPIANTTIYLLDDGLEPVPQGAIGEAWVGGDGVARGYLNDATATRERFIASPFTAGETLYRTGDRMRRRPDGALEFIGRSDDQVKIRGFRVEPAEIEQVLQGCPGVKRALVRAEGDRAGSKRLCAYVVAEHADPAFPAVVRRSLRSKLPGYMVPACISLVASLPVDRNGKRMRPTLIDQPASAPAAETSPRDAWERIVARAFAEVLGNGPVGIHDSFFDVSGDSLAAIRLVSVLARKTRRQLPLARLYENPTIAELARELREQSLPTALGPDVMMLKTGRAARPLFLVPGGRGGKPELTICAKLVSRLGSHETVCGLLASPTTGRPVEELAALHLGIINRLQPKGPYRVGGECIGGLIAYEIAQQLWARGETVELLLLLDTWCPSGKGQLSSTRTLPLGPRKLVGKSIDLLRAGMAFLAELPQREPGAIPWPLELWRRVTVPKETKHHIETCMRYQPFAYPGKITILASTESLRNGLAEPWQELAVGGTIVHQAPGDHESYSRRYFHETAEQLRICLEEQTRERVEHGQPD